MKNLLATALRFENSELKILNQKKLPHVEEWDVCNTTQNLYDCIFELRVRGAPLIGIAAVIFLAHRLEQGDSIEVVKIAAEKIKSSRPTAVNLAHCIHRFLEAMTVSRSHAIHSAENMFDEDEQLCERMAEHGAALINSGDNVMTYCNTGSLATAGVGTALGVINKAHQQGKKIHVFVNETRPLLQGGRLTAWELERLKIPYTLICDNMAAYLMATQKIHRIFVGSDRVARNGDFANKIGTYNLAVIAKYHEVPFYVVAPYTTIDKTCLNSREIEIEQRKADEVRGVEGSFGKIIWSPEKSPVWNPSFDVTPQHLVTRYIFDNGVMKADEIAKN